MEQVNINIRKRRKELGMSQDVLAKKIGYTDRSSIAKIETGVVDVTIIQLRKIAAALETTPLELLDYLWKDDSEE